MAAVYALRLGDVAADLMRFAPKLEVHASGDLHVSKDIGEFGVWEAYETKLLLEALPSDGVFVDAGANLGYYSVLAGLKAQAGRVYSFEPEPKNFALLQSNIRLNALSNIDAFNLALSTEAGAGEIYLNPDNFGDHQIYSDGEARQSTQIELACGDEVLAGLEYLNVLKVDTQGAEFQVLSGLQQLIRRSLEREGNAVSMVVEFWPKGLARSGANADAVLDILLSYNLPMAIVDQQESRLIPCEEFHIRDWIVEVDNDPNNEGFLNLFLSNQAEFFA